MVDNRSSGESAYDPPTVAPGNYYQGANWKAAGGYWYPPPVAPPPATPFRPPHRPGKTARIVIFVLLGFIALVGGCIVVVVHSIDSLHFNFNFPSVHSPSLYGMNVAFLPGGTEAYVSVPSKNLLDVYNVSSGAIIGKIAVGQTPTGLAVSPNGSQVWVADTSVYSLENSGGQSGGSVSVVATRTNHVVANISLPGGPIDVAFSPNGLTAYATVNGVLSGGYVAVMNTSTFKVVAKLTPTFNATSVAPNMTTSLVSPSSTQAPTTTQVPSTTYLPTPNLSECLSSDSASCWHPTSVAVNPNGSQVWVSEAYAVPYLPISLPGSTYSSDYVYVFNTANNEEIASIKVGDGAFFMAMSKDGKYIYVANKVSCSIDEISTATFEVVYSLHAPVVDGCPYGIAASTTDSVAYTVTGNDRTVNMGQQGDMLEMVNFITGKVTALRSVGSDPVTVTLSPAGDSMYIADAQLPVVTAISIRTYETTGILHLPVPPPRSRHDVKPNNR